MAASSAVPANSAPVVSANNEIVDATPLAAAPANLSLEALFAHYHPQEDYRVFGILTQGDYRVFTILDRALYNGAVGNILDDAVTGGGWWALGTVVGPILILLYTDLAPHVASLVAYLVPATTVGGVLLGLLSLVLYGVAFIVYGAVSWGVAKTCLVAAGHFIPRGSAFVYKELAYQISCLTGTLAGLAVIAAAAAVLATPLPLYILLVVGVATFARILNDISDVLYRNSPASPAERNEMNIREQTIP